MSMDGEKHDDDVPSRFRVEFGGRTLLGIYRVGKRMAEGGMGSVYAAEDTNLGRRVVVKVPHARFLGVPEFRSRFGREIAELVRIEHPHVVRILARGEEDEVPFFVLQFLGGGSLEDRLRDGPQDPGAAVSWLETIAQTLDYVHGQGVVHRDVKPANILFDEGGHVFLSDFGVVKALGRDDGAEKTEAGTGVGSPLHMAPEQAMGKDVGPASDQFALASTLYEALSGEPPHGRGPLLEVLLRKQAGSLPSFAEIRPPLPEVSAAAIRRALSLDPALRFPTCAEFAREYARGLAPSVPVAPPPAGSPSRARWVLGAAVAVVALGAAGLLVWRPSSTGAGPVAVALRPTDEVFVLAERGAEPRRALRQALVVGAAAPFVFASKLTMKQNATGEAPAEATVASETPVAARVASVGGDGRAQIDWTFERAKVVVPAGEKSDLLEAQQKIVDAMGVVRMTSASGSLGGALEIHAEKRSGLSAEAEGLLAGAEDWVRSFSVGLPQEPVGVGAVWDVTRVARVMGLRFQQTTSYELTKVEGPRLFLRLRSEQNAMPQGFTMPGMPPEITTKLKSFHSSLEGEIVVDLGSPAPVRYEVKGNVAFEAVVTGADVPPEAAVRFESAFENRIRRE